MIHEEVPNWEAAKENVLPAKRGRTVKGLKDITTLKCSTEAQESDKENERFKQRLSQCHDLNEKLDIYVMYVKWARDNFPNEASKEKKALEMFTKEYTGKTEFYNDVRLVKLWIEYADKVRDQAETFSFMYTNKIGERLSLFYVAWAFVAEKDANMKAADTIFQKGIKRLAEPKDILVKRYHQFQRRLARQFINSAQEGTIETGGGARDVAPLATLSGHSAPHAPQRAVLGQRSENSSAPSHTQSAGHSGINHPHGVAQSKATPKVPQKLFEVFDENNPRGFRPHTTSASNPAVQPAPSWTHFGDEGERKKENSGGPAVAWNMASLPPQSTGLAIPSAAPSLVIFDEFSAKSVSVHGDTSTQPQKPNNPEKKIHGLGGSARGLGGATDGTRPTKPSAVNMAIHSQIDLTSKPATAKPSIAIFSDIPKPVVTAVPPVPANLSFSIFSDVPSEPNNEILSLQDSLPRKADFSIKPAVQVEKPINPVFNSSESSKASAITTQAVQSVCMASEDVYLNQTENVESDEDDEGDGTINFKMAKRDIDELFASPSLKKVGDIGGAKTFGGTKKEYVRCLGAVGQNCGGKERKMEEFSIFKDLSCIKESRDSINGTLLSEAEESLHLESLHTGGSQSLFEELVGSQGHNPPQQRLQGRNYHGVGCLSRRRLYGPSSIYDPLQVPSRTQLSSSEIELSGETPAVEGTDAVAMQRSVSSSILPAFKVLNEEALGLSPQPKYLSLSIAPNAQPSQQVMFTTCSSESLTPTRSLPAFVISNQKSEEPTMKSLLWDSELCDNEHAPQAPLTMPLPCMSSLTISSASQPPSPKISEKSCLAGSMRFGDMPSDIRMDIDDYAHDKDLEVECCVTLLSNSHEQVEASQQGNEGYSLDNAIALEHEEVWISVSSTVQRNSRDIPAIICGGESINEVACNHAPATSVMNEPLSFAIHEVDVDAITSHLVVVGTECDVGVQQLSIDASENKVNGLHDDKSSHENCLMPSSTVDHLVQDNCVDDLKFANSHASQGLQESIAPPSTSVLNISVETLDRFIHAHANSLVDSVSNLNEWVTDEVSPLQNNLALPLIFHVDYPRPQQLAYRSKYANPVQVLLPAKSSLSKAARPSQSLAQFNILRTVGRGAFGHTLLMESERSFAFNDIDRKIHMGRKIQRSSEEKGEDTLDEESSDVSNMYVLKVDNKRTYVMWETYIFALIQFRLDSLVRLYPEAPRFFSQHFLPPVALVTYTNAACMYMPYASLGTLMDITAELVEGGGFGVTEHEVLCMVLSMQMLRALSVLHSAGVAHCDIKTDNWVVRENGHLKENEREERCPYDLNENEMLLVDLCLIDMGKARLLDAPLQSHSHATNSAEICVNSDVDINTRLLALHTHALSHATYQPPNAPSLSLASSSFHRHQIHFCHQGNTLPNFCSYKKEFTKRESGWRGEVDCMCVADCIHQLLFKEPLRLQRVAHASQEGHFARTIVSKLRRYWVKVIWNKVFHDLLNVELSGSKEGSIEASHQAAKDKLWSSHDLLHKEVIKNKECAILVQWKLLHQLV